MSESMNMHFYVPETDIKAALVIVHGMAEHHARYIPFAEYLKKQGYAVGLFDLPGHGAETPEKDLGHSEKGGWMKMVAVVKGAVCQMKEAFPGVKHFVMGHSMGSMLVRCFLQENDSLVDGVILSGAPCYQSAVPVGIKVGEALRLVRGERGHSKMMDGLVTGSFLKSVENPETPYDWLSYNKDNVRNYAEDPLCGFPFTIQGYIEELSGMVMMHDSTRYERKNPGLPILFAAGEDDPCTGGTKGLQDSINTLRRAGYEEPQVILYHGMRHEILNETDKDKVYQDISAWLDMHK